MTLEYMGEAHESPTVLMRGRLEGWGWKRQKEILRRDAVSTDCGGGNQEPKACSEARKAEARKPDSHPGAAAGTVIPQ